MPSPLAPTRPRCDLRFSRPVKKGRLGEIVSNIRILALALAIAAVPTADATTAKSGELPDTLSFGNRTCGALTLTLDSDAPCTAFSSGCQLPLDVDQVLDVDLKQPHSMQFLEVKIEGRCPGQPATRISGRCMMNLDQMFPYRIWSSGDVWPVASTGRGYDMGLMDSPGDYPGYYPGWTPYDTGVAPNAAAVDIGLADCEASGDGATQVCTASCQSHSR